MGGTLREVVYGIPVAASPITGIAAAQRLFRTRIGAIRNASPSTLYFPPLAPNPHSARCFFFEIGPPWCFSWEGRQARGGRSHEPQAAAGRRTRTAAAGVVCRLVGPPRGGVSGRPARRRVETILSGQLAGKSHDQASICRTRRSRSPRAPATRAITLDAPAGSISGTAAAVAVISMIRGLFADDSGVDQLEVP